MYFRGTYGCSYSRVHTIAVFFHPNGFLPAAKPKIFSMRHCLRLAVALQWLERILLLRLPRGVARGTTNGEYAVVSFLPQAPALSSEGASQTCFAGQQMCPSRLQSSSSAQPRQVSAKHGTKGGEGRLPLDQKVLHEVILLHVFQHFYTREQQ